MSYSVTINGTAYTLPSPGETGWGANVDAFFVALGNGLFRSGGSQPLTAPLLLGAYGITAGNFSSNTVASAASGQVSLASTDTVAWRNTANSGDNSLGVNAAGVVQFVLSGGGTYQLMGHPHAIYQSTVGQSIPANTQTVLNFNTPELDTDSAVTTGASWKFTVPASKPGLYSVSFAATYATAPGTGTNSVVLTKNGTPVRSMWCLVGVPTASTVATGQTLINLAVGDQLDLRMTNTGTGTAVLSNGSSANSICITRLGN